MMKKIVSYFFAVVLALVSASCAKEAADSSGEGTINLSMSVLPVELSGTPTKAVTDENWEDGFSYKSTEDAYDYRLDQLILYFFSSDVDAAVCGLRYVLNSGDFTYDASTHIATINKTAVPMAKLAKCINGSQQTYVFAIANCCFPNGDGTTTYVLADDASSEPDMNEGVTLSALKAKSSPDAHFDWGGTGRPVNLLMTGTSLLDWDDYSKTLSGNVPMYRMACKIRLFVSMPNELWDSNGYRWVRNTDNNPRDSIRYHSHNISFDGTANHSMYPRWVQYLDHQIDVDDVHYFTTEQPFYVYPPRTWADGVTSFGGLECIAIVSQWRKYPTEYWGITDELDRQDETWDTKAPDKDEILRWTWRYHRLRLEATEKLQRNTYYRYVLTIESLGGKTANDEDVVYIN